MLSTLSRHQMLSLTELTAHCGEVIPRLVRRAYENACFACAGNDSQLSWLRYVYASATKSDDWPPRRIAFYAYSDHQVEAMIRLRDRHGPVDLLWIHSAQAFAEATPARIERTFFSSLSRLHRLLRAWGFDSGPYTGNQMHIMCERPFPDDLSMMFDD